MLTRPELKVVLMSATVDAQRFSKYLNDAPILNVPGRTFPVQTRYLEDAIEMTHYTAPTGDKAHDSDRGGNDDEDAPKEKSGIPSKLTGYSSTTHNVLADYDEYAIDYDLIVRLMEVVAFDAQLSRYSNAVLCFLPGIAEIRQMNDLLLAHPSFDNSWLIYPLHSSISSEEQQAAFLLPPPGTSPASLTLVNTKRCVSTSADSSLDLHNHSYPARTRSSDVVVLDVCRKACVSTCSQNIATII
jgi:ATP-dependent RNA helicase DHX29